MCCLLCFSVFVKAAFKISDNFCLLVSVFRGERGEVCSEDSKRFSYLRRECYKSVVSRYFRLLFQECYKSVCFQIFKSSFSTFSLKVLNFKYINVKQKWGVCDKTGFI